MGQASAIPDKLIGYSRQNVDRFERILSFVNQGWGAGFQSSSLVEAIARYRATSGTLGADVRGVTAGPPLVDSVNSVVSAVRQTDRGVNDVAVAFVNADSGAKTHPLLKVVRTTDLAIDQAMRNPNALRDYWLKRAADNAGIDVSKWDPDLGSNALKGTITNVYTYYGRLFLNNPYLQWAGMANMIGPSFAAGFFDLAMLRKIAKVVAGVPGAPAGLDIVAKMTDAELRFFEKTFLVMQRKIFEDQAVMHEAYLGGGLAAIRELFRAGVLDQGTLDAWTQIDKGRLTGDENLIRMGNVRLLLREQRDIIDRYYQQMYDHPTTGPAFTYLMTAIGEPSIPGAQSFGDYKPLVIKTETPGPSKIPLTPWDNPFQGDLTVQTPLPDGNLAHFNDRWTYISQDTLPAYQKFLHDHPEAASKIISSDVGGRIDQYRIYHRIDTLLQHYETDWSVDFDQ